MQERFAAGEKKLQGVLIGAVMKKSKGSADPKRVNQLLAERIGTLPAGLRRSLSTASSFS